MSVIIESVTLDRVQLFQMQILDEELRSRMRKDIRVCTHMDAYEMRRAFTGWGRVERRTLTCPATWWQHLKLALRTRWPRVFGRLHVLTESATVENGAIVTGLSAKLGGRHLVIPLAMPTTRTTYVTDGSDDEPEYQ